MVIRLRSGAGQSGGLHSAHCSCGGQSMLHARLCCLGAQPGACLLLWAHCPQPFCARRQGTRALRLRDRVTSAV